MTEEILMTVEQVAEMLQMSTRFVYTLVRTGEIPHIKMGKFYRFRRNDIDGWLEESIRRAS